MRERVLAELYGRREDLSWRSEVPGRRTCRSSGLRPGLYFATMTADALVAGAAERVETEWMG